MRTTCNNECRQGRECDCTLQERFEAVAEPDLPMNGKTLAVAAVAIALAALLSSFAPWGWAG